MIQDTIARARSLIADKVVTRASLARSAGLHTNTLRNIDDDDWNPTAQTLLKLEAWMTSRDSASANAHSNVMVPLAEDSFVGRAA